MISQSPSGGLNKWMSFHVRQRWMDGWSGHYSLVTCDM